MNSPFKNFGPIIRTEDGIRAARIAIDMAKSQSVQCAICGGLLMHLYGFTRATKDIDFVASNLLNITPTKSLSFGGQSFKLDLSGEKIEVDWIVRNDELADLYQMALTDRITLDDEFPAISPEWLVVIKHLAGRGKDHMDCVWLLRQDGLVDRDLMIAKIKIAMGKHAFWAIKDLESLMLEADLMKARDEKNDK
jgi:hypothetical protein